MSHETTPTLTILRARWRAQLDERPACPRGCRGRTWHDGSRPRKATIRLEESCCFLGELEQRRKRCSVCRGRWTHRPEGVSSAAHYQPCVVSHAIVELGTEADASTTRVAAEVGCAPRTVRRWAERVAVIAEPAELASRIAEEAGEPVLPPMPVELSAPQRSPRLGALLLRALSVLVLLEALASLQGVAPPALAHAADLIPADVAGPHFKGDPPRPS